MHESVYPTLFAAAMDYLPIQASAVPCERVFSLSGETATKRRNCMKPDLMEALQLLKFMRKKEQLNFTEGWQVDTKDLASDESSHIELGDLLTTDNGENADHILCESDGEADSPPKKATTKASAVIEVD
jgi:hypothetical protein